MDKACTCTGLACVDDKFKCETCKDKGHPMRKSEEQIEKEAWEQAKRSELLTDHGFTSIGAEIYIHAYRKALADSEAWVDVKERLPEPQKNYLVLTKNESANYRPSVAHEIDYLHSPSPSSVTMPCHPSSPPLTGCFSKSE